MLRGPILVALALALSLAAPAPASAPAASKASCKRVARPAPKQNGGRKPPKTKLDPSKRYDIAFTTNCGSFTIRLDVRDSPHTTASFVTLTRTGFFTRTILHRIVPGFVIQGGDPLGTGYGGPGYTVVDRPPRNTVYREYTAAMAKGGSDPAGTSGSQFFVVTGTNVQLPADYALLGTVITGRPVVDLIGRLGNATTQRPTQVIEILKTAVTVH